MSQRRDRAFVRSIIVLFALSLAAGCLSSSDAPAGAPTKVSSCPTEVAPPARSGPAVEIQVANNMAVPTCVRIFFDDVLVAAAALPEEDPGLHANPVAVGQLAWPTGSVRVRVVADASGSALEESVTLEAGPENWVVAWVDEAGSSLRVYTSEPRWM